MKDGIKWTEASDTPEGFARTSEIAHGEINGEPYRMVEFSLPPYPIDIDEKEHKLIVRVPIGKLPAPMFTDTLIKHVTDTLGKRDAKLVLDKLVDEYYRQLVTKQM